MTGSIQMWNVFDTAFVVTTALYLILRYKGLSSGSSELYLASTSDSLPHLVGPLFTIATASDLGFDILACGACILFPRSDSYLFYFGVDLQLSIRLAFFLVSNNVVILYVLGCPSFTFHMPTLPTLVALSVL